MERQVEKGLDIPASDYKFCVDLVVQDWQVLEDKDMAREEVSRFLRENKLIDRVSGFSVDAVRKGVINVSFYSDDKSLGALLRETPDAYTHFGVDIRDQNKPILLPEDVWLKT